MPEPNYNQVVSEIKTMDLSDQLRLLRNGDNHSKKDQQGEASQHFRA